MNYSYETSLPAYHSFPEDKKRQQDIIFELIKGGADNLLKLSELTGLEQGRISARISDLIKDCKIKYSSKVIYKGFERKKIILVKPVIIGTQTNLFDHVK